MELVIQKYLKIEKPIAIWYKIIIWFNWFNEFLQNKCDIVVDITFYFLFLIKYHRKFSNIFLKDKKNYCILYKK